MRVIDLFRALDKNADGQVTRQELAEALRSLGISASRDEVRDLYLTLGNAWEGRLADVARQSLLETWSLFETDAFYTRRQAINAAMVSSVNASLHQFHAEATIVSMRQLKFAEQAHAPPAAHRPTHPTYTTPVS